jgi:phosphopantothenoylcysteine decarboxylase/phosphopantothenate--cysteine ligase
MLRFLITAGPTREYIDPVRFISNDSSGRMGFALAQAAVRRGHSVTLVHGPVALPLPPGARCVAAISARQMLAACRRFWPRHDVLIMAAAVADYEPARRSRHKIRGARGQRVLRLRPTPDVLATLSASRHPGQVVIGFALEDRQPRRSASAKLRRKNLDAIVLNSPRAISATRSRLEVLVAGQGWERWPPGNKTRLAERLIRLAERLFAGSWRNAPASGYNTVL